MSALGVKGSHSQFLPSASISGNTQWSQQRVSGSKRSFFGMPMGYVQPYTAHSRDYGYQIQLTQTLFNWADWENLNASQSAYVTAKLNTLQTDNELAQKVANAYLTVAQAQSDLVLAQQQLVQGNKLLHITEQRYAAGQLISTALDNMRANYVSEQSQILTAKSNLVSARSQLSSLVNQVPENVDEVSVSDTLAPLLNTEKEWLHQAYDHSPALLAAQQAVKTAKYQVKQAKSAYLPTVTSSIGYQKYYVVSPGGPMNNLQGNINVNIPLDLNGAINTEVGKADLGVQQAELTVQSVKIQIKQAIENGFKQLQLDEQQIAMMKKLVVSREKALHSEKIIYAAGMGDASDVISAHNNLYTTKNQLQNTIYTYWQQRIVLLTTTGLWTKNNIDRISQVFMS